MGGGREERERNKVRKSADLVFAKRCRERSREREGEWCGGEAVICISAVSKARGGAKLGRDFAR
jgi:hypothetical protein